ncbi:MAG: amidophosphoribosyltransferase [Desulfobacterota bacterium]|nr:amidophosphoribosyltransferase [Thermodesulfobacteriota bacterium]
MKEFCGLFGVYGIQDAASLIYRGLFALQHRGQEGAGIVVSDGIKIRSYKGMGLVGDVFTDQILSHLTGTLGIGHVRYSTTGSTRIQNVQPLVAECADGIWAIAHNGNLVNAATLRSMYQESGSIFQTSTDSEVLVHILADPLFRRRPRRVERALGELRGAFSFLLMTKDTVMAARDPHGFRPLSLGKLGEGYIITSETCALPLIGAQYIRDVEPGELVTIDHNGLHYSRFSEPQARHAQCIFEHIYFAHPDSYLFGHNVHSVRMHYGSLLAQEHPIAADIVIPIPDSGNSAALGYARKSGIALDFGFIRNHYVGRTFIMPDDHLRKTAADIKLAVLPEVVSGKRVVAIDDSIVRGNTSSKRIAYLRDAGAREIHVRISCPPIRYPCFYGIDFPTRQELIAATKSVEEIRRMLGADSLGYLSLEGLLSPFKKPQDFCTACFTGDYPAEPVDAQYKEVFEKEHDL